MSDNLAVRWDLKINGKTSLPDGYRALIEQITVDASVDGAAELSITASAWDSIGGAFRFVGETMLAPGNSVVLYIGYEDDAPVAIQRFRIVREEAEYPEGGTPKVKISGYSAEARLGSYTDSRTFPAPSVDSEIVRQIATEHGLLVTADSLQPTAPRATRSRVKEKGTSDLVFLQGLAEANSYGPPIVRYDDVLGVDILYFRTQTLTQELGLKLRLVWNPSLGGAGNANLLSFQPTLDLHGVPTKVEVRGWDREAGTAVVVIMEIADAGQDPVILTGAAAKPYKIKSGSEFQARALKEGQETAKEKKEVLTPLHSIRTTDDAVAYATRWIKTRNSAFVTARARTLGIPTLWIGQVHEIAGVADVHAGLWLVEGVVHTIGDGGYTCDVDFARVLTESSNPLESA